MKFLKNFTEPIKILAPMVNNSDLAYRTLARKYGADICYTEMLHCKQFLQSKSNPQKNNWFRTNENEKSLVIQLCGNDPDIMTEVAKQVEPFCDAIDLNFGCPQNIAKKGNYGAFLQNDLNLTQEIIQKISSNISKPLFCKIRIFEDLYQTMHYAKMIESAGCELLAVHGRTKEQKGIMTGLANWGHIKVIKENLSIPVISNGNILYKSDIDKCIEYTKCDGVMVAETHLYNPLIFYDGDNKDCFEIILEYLQLCEEIPTKNIEIKSHVYKILHKVLDDQVLYKERIALAKTINDLKLIINDLKMVTNEQKIYLAPRIRSHPITL